MLKQPSLPFVSTDRALPINLHDLLDISNDKPITALMMIPTQMMYTATFSEATHHLCQLL